ncbi:MAG: DUF3426 domain-containing protein [Desulfuromonadales bacterium]
MIVQCEACQTRFRLADEKIKPGGIKVRCSKCKEIFSVAPPEPEPVEETVDFGAFNMEAVPEEQPSETAAADSPAEDASAPQQEPASDTEAEQVPEPAEEAQSSDARDDELDFSRLAQDMDDAATGEEPAEEFFFADTSQPVDGDETSSAADTDVIEETGAAQPEGAPADFDASAEEDDEPGGPIEFGFEEDSATPGEQASAKPAVREEEEQEAVEFSFETTDAEDTAAPTGEEPADFDFGDQDDDNAFSFDDQSPGESGTADEWGEDSPAGDTFDFDEPHFDSDTSESESTSGDAAEAGMQFGEIDFSSDETDSATPSLPTEDPYAKAPVESQDEPGPFTPRKQTPSPSRADDVEEPLPVPPPPKKSSLSRILLLLILLLVVLGGAAGFLFMQEGSVNLTAVTQYLPFLKDYVGGPQEAARGDRIGINISDSSYVNGQAGQMLVIQGAAVNNYTGNRSSIVIKGTLLDAQGKALRQQTVFCGNPLDETALAKMPFSAIEEAMNNEFGDSLSNINIAAGASIPFTIVFRNLPAGIANINVEVVDSKPGGG